jgi:hypothetical protein
MAVMAWRGSDDRDRRSHEHARIAALREQNRRQRDQPLVRLTSADPAGRLPGPPTFTTSEARERSPGEHHLAKDQPARHR